LPSFNVRLGVTEDQFFRFAYSRAISRPDFGLARSNFNIEDGGIDAVTGAYLGPIVRTGNVGLDPILADQFDLSWEWYFSNVGSLTVTGFYKNLQNYITPTIGTVGTIGLPDELAELETNNGVTLPIDFESTGNASEDAGISGFEIAYQQVYDFIPAPFNGLGVQANYTYVASDSVPIVTPKNDEPNGILLPAASDDTLSQLDAPLLSEHTANLIGFYESERFTARLAYNWRSEYTLTARDVVFPFTPIIQEGYGQLDGSFFYNLSDNLKIGVQAVNLTDAVVETRAVIDEAGVFNVPRNFSRADRRYTLTLRGAF
jgi:TonB-dependent receptor